MQSSVTIVSTRLFNAGESTSSKNILPLETSIYRVKVKTSVFSVSVYTGFYFISKSENRRNLNSILNRDSSDLSHLRVASKH